MAVAEFLRVLEKVQWVNYPGLADNRFRALADRYMPKGCSSLLSFGINGGLRSGIQFIEKLELLSHLANIGDAKIFVIHPASTTPGQLGEEQQVAVGVGPVLIRLSVGTERKDDIIFDVAQALETL